jgi:hypothetical protein
MTRQHGRIDRRSFTAAALVAGASLAFPGRARAAAPDPLSGDALFALVRQYDRLGEHRTATPGDEATSEWMAAKLRAAGFQVSLQPFDIPLFDPVRTEIAISGKPPVTDAFPLWPPRPTPADGLTGPLSLAGNAQVEGGILVVDLPYTRGGSLSAPPMLRAIEGAVKRRPLAIIGITESPTGAVVAQNVEIGRPQWPIPILLVGSRAGAALKQAATSRKQATLISTGTVTPHARATNVVARRPAPGKAIVVSTPKSGWFNVAGERGSGIALFLGLAAWAERNTDDNLLFVATSGHELGNHGGHVFQKALAPRPADVRLWMHIGANVASNAVSFDSCGRVQRLAAVHPTRGMLASDAVVAAARRGFAGQPGYENPAPDNTDRAVGEVEVYRDAGYTPIVGLVGGHPLHHTPADRSEVVTSPAALEPVARGLATIIQSVAR